MGRGGGGDGASIETTATFVQEQISVEAADNDVSPGTFLD